MNFVLHFRITFNLSLQADAPKCAMFVPELLPYLGASNGGGGSLSANEYNQLCTVSVCTVQTFVNTCTILYCYPYALTTHRDCNLPTLTVNIISLRVY